MMIWIKMIFIILFVVVCLPKTILASDTLCHTDVRHCKSTREKPIREPIDIVTFDGFTKKNEMFEILFTPNTFIFNSSAKIDSLFYAMIMEIRNLPAFGWIDYRTYEWLEADIKNCKQITIPKSLFSLLNKIEQDSLYSIVKKAVPVLSVADTLFNTVNFHPSVDIIACSIRTNIEQGSNEKYTLTLNNTRYKMVELSNNHYMLRKEKEK